MRHQTGFGAAGDCVSNPPKAHTVTQLIKGGMRFLNSDVMWLRLANRRSVVTQNLWAVSLSVTDFTMRPAKDR